MKRTILELDIDVDAIIANSARLKKELDSQRVQLDGLKRSGDTSSEAYVKLAAQVSKTSGEFNLSQKQLTNLAAAGGSYLDIQTKATLALDKEINSIDNARKNNTELLKIRNALNLSKESEKRLADEINLKLDQNNAFIKENVSAYEKQKIGIGDYKTAIKEALAENNIFGDQLTRIMGLLTPFSGTFQILKKDLNEAWQEIKGNTVATEGMTTAQIAGARATAVLTGGMKLLRVALIATGIGAIVVLLGSLIAYLSTTQSGIDAVTSVTRPLQAIFQSILGVLQDVGERLFKTFKDPKKAIADLGEFVKQNLINRFKAFGEIIKGIMDLDFKRVANGAAQAVTGVENMSGKIAGAAQATGKFLADAAKKGAEIDRLTKEAEKAQLAYNRQQIKTNDLIDEQLLKSKDTSLTFAEREKAAQEIIRLTQELGDQEAAIIEKKIAALKIQQSLNDTSREGVQEMIDLETQLDAARDRGLEAQKEQMRVIAGARKEAAAKAAQERQEALTDAAAKMKAELDLYMQTAGAKAKTMQAELDMAAGVRDRSLAVAKADFEATKKTATDKLNFQKATNEALEQFTLSQVEIASKYAKAELDLFIANNRSKVEGEKMLTQEILDAEAARLEQVRTMRLEQLATEKQTSQEAIDAKIAANEQLSIADMEYLVAKSDIELEAQRQLQANKDAFEAQTKQRKAEQLAIDRELELANAQSKYEQDVLLADQKNADELARFNDLLEQKKISQEQYNELELSANKKMQEAKKLARLEEVTDTLGGLGRMTSGLEGFFGKNKAIASATAVINGGMAVMEILKAPAAPFVEPFASVVRGIQIAGAVATTARNVAQINKAKFKWGGAFASVRKMFSRGAVLQGPSHENGGIDFTIDGKPGFNAEGEEIILTKGVWRNPFLRRIASKINSAAGGVEFAKGAALASSSFNFSARQGSSDFLDYDTLAGKLAEANRALPPGRIAIEDINTGQAGYAEVVNGANL
jgi:hypothetical protein